jgi:hypothetical protein
LGLEVLGQQLQQLVTKQVAEFLLLAQLFLLVVVQVKQEMEQVVLLWEGLLAALAVVERVGTLLVQDLLATPLQQRQAKETMAATELQMELRVLVVVEVELVLLVAMLLTPALVMVGMEVQVQRQLLLAQVLLTLVVVVVAVGSALLELAAPVAAVMAVGIT